MTHIRLVTGVIEDLERIDAHLRDHESVHAAERPEEIVSAFDVLAGNPLIGRPVHADHSELVMGRGSHGYVAVYRYVDVTDTVIVMALRAQREAGYARDA
ncbi:MULTISPECIES: type II toxin-antitoxin system RelE/ParE family toxin [unclassified Xanthomonas]|uniref:type II toxin-antitoxin system RelE/ParE family toxin n=1 Tax=unclassified Xanthomonas TaxID=2643310 RepID=UPI002B22561E|nr:MULTISPECIES: type II toxin-antitoxin system RelE/ParE family toxin [unclassified Xanthomonas]MEA9564334.1 type II toxin-antitoxin system RelE/ParE family toxin [Xanthomonas sp. WHRI 8932A]MEA9636106.1 type II toxin-antitoxin system RelE/ParE family toxin [Xanthomonas sp. WHRI 8812E]